MIENMYFVAIHDLSLKCIIQYVTLNRYKWTAPPRKDFLQVSKEVYWKKLKEKILHRSFYSISVDERTDQIMEHQLIVYITYLTMEEEVNV